MPKTIIIIKPKTKSKVKAPKTKPLKAPRISKTEQLLLRVFSTIKPRDKKFSTIAKRMDYAKRHPERGV